MDWNTRIRAALAARLPGDEVIEELTQHAAAMYEAARAEGLSREEAERRVAEQLDCWRADAASLHHKSRRPPMVEPPPASSPRWFAGLTRDVVYAARLLRRQPRFTLLASLTMALGIGATTLLFTVVYGVLVKPLPWVDADRLVVLAETRGGNRPRFGSFSNTAYLAWQADAPALESLAAWSQRTATLTGAGDPDRIRVAAASASLFRVLRARPVIGSFFSDADESVSSGAAIVVSESLWRTRFGADPAVLGRALQLDGQPFTIVGVLPDRSSFPDRRTRAWIPFRVPPAGGNYLAMFEAVARLNPGVTPQRAAAEGTARGHFAADTGMTTSAIFGGQGPVGVSVTPLADAVAADIRRPLLLLMAAVVLLLATATANVGGLQLARAASRRREIAIRAALGAGTGRVIRQLLAESLVLGAIGGLTGIGLAWLMLQALPALLPADFPRVDDLGFNATVLVFAVATTLVVSIVFGMLPAVRAGRLNLLDSLAEDGTVVTGAGSSRAGHARVVIMISQVAIACLLLVGASLLGRSFLALVTVDRGYEPSGLLTARLALPSTAYTPERRFAIVDEVLERLGTVPGATDVGFTSELPLTAGGSTSAFTLRHDGKAITVQASPRIVSARSFPALGMRIASGRGFSEMDTEAATPVAVVNRTFARRYLDDDALGVQLPMGLGYQQDEKAATIVGVVDDVRYLSPEQPSQPEIYYTYRQFGARLAVPTITVLVRTERDPIGLAASLRAAVRAADRSLVPEAVMSMQDRLLLGLARPRLYTVVLGAFACFAMVVAAVGLFSVLSQTVVDRSREIAVRTALGARPLDIVGFILKQGLLVTAAGLLVGLASAASLGRWMSSLLYGVSAYDAPTYILVPLALVSIAAVACLVPALRAARMDPARVLRG